ncbi:helix-turn-helix domain-containing protein [Actinoplanes regularis]|uniref:helix-turn-helix domain-containing protein n=1 Tax=Actinoplanes regularis TaxID=52697 RepID=UPI001177CB41|nr:helix-turn-helix transcriptional regulator [Actinoplanes regularis]
MARQEKAVDPAAGPLQAFAFELRKVRTEAGGPTYRALARSAGYSAATLSEAAGGTRKPTLDVVLAYVGACRGDVDLWRRRWHELDTALTSAPLTEAGPVPVAEADPVPLPEADPVEPAPSAPLDAVSRRGRPSPRRLVAWAAVPVLLTATAGGVYLARDQRGSGCPEQPAHPAFTAVSYGAGARAHTGAARDAPITRTIPSGCTIGFVGYCLGEKIHDNTGGTPDVRWFKLPDGDVVASGIVHGNPPRGLAASRCVDDRTPPGTIALTAAVDPAKPGTVRLKATGTRLDIVGFAALYQPAEPPTARRWRQIGFTEETAGKPGFGVSWRLGGVATGPDPVLIAAVACLGGDGPTGIVDVRSAGAGRLGPKFPPVSLTASQRAEAVNAACSYPA